MWRLPSEAPGPCRPHVTYAVCRSGLSRKAPAGQVFNGVSVVQANNALVTAVLVLSVTSGSRWDRQSVRSLIRVVSEPRSFGSTGLPKTFWSFAAPGTGVCVCRGQVSAVRPPGGGISVRPSQPCDLHRHLCSVAAWPSERSALF